MEKLGRAWSRLSTRHLSHGRSVKKVDDDDENVPPDTKKEVFELFAKSGVQRKHRQSAVSNTSCGDHVESARPGQKPKSMSLPKPVPQQLLSSGLPCQSASARPASESPQNLQATESLSPPTPTTKLMQSSASDLYESADESAPGTSITLKAPSPMTVTSTAYEQDNKSLANSPADTPRVPSPNRLSPEDAQTKANSKAVSVGSDSRASSTSSEQFKQQTKRRSSVFVKRGSVSMEPIKRVELEEVYAVYKQLGTGRFGCIKLAEHKESGRKIAIKFFPRPQSKQVDFIREYNYSFFLSPHPNIIDTYEGMYQTNDDSAFFFVQELCPCASLREAVEASPSGIGETATRAIMSKVMAAIEFMHSENLVHRNLKAENILIFDSKEYSKVKVTDFGLTRKVDSAVKYLEYVNNYHAPELCETVVNEVLTVNRSIDIWAIGIIFYYCLKGRFPWQKATIMCKPYWEWEQWLKRKNPQLPKRWEPFSEKSLKLLKKTLNPKWKDRWSAKDVRKCIVKEKLLKTQKVSEEM